MAEPQSDSQHRANPLCRGLAFLSTLRELQLSDSCLFLQHGFERPGVMRGTEYKLRYSIACSTASLPDEP
jgi:hypothetical protein